MADIADCTACALHKTCTQPIGISGKAPARIAVVIEGPGKTDDQRNKLFMPPLIKTALKDVGVDLQQMALVPAVGCWPSDDNMNWDHVAACAPNRAQHLDQVDPQFVLLCGEVPLRAFQPELSIRFARGHGWVDGQRTFFATYGAGTVAGSEEAELTFTEDMQVFAKIVEGHEPFFVGNDRCVACPAWAEWWDSSGLPWCQEHLAGEDLYAFNVRSKLISEQLGSARARAGV